MVINPILNIFFAVFSMAAASFTTGNPLLDFLYILFNGISEVPLISSPLAGLLILAGVTVASRKAGFMMFISGLIGAAVAYILGASYGLITFGLFGYNSILTGMAFWSGPFTKRTKAALAMSIIGAAITAVVWMALSHVMGDWFAGLGPGYAIPGFTASFIFTTWAMMYATKLYGLDIWPAPPPSGSNQTEQPFKWTAKEFMRATLNGVSQVTFVEDWRTGLFWVAGLTLSFQLAPGALFTNAYTAGWDATSLLYLGGLMALVGSGVGAAVAIAAKLPAAEVRSGLHGFNQVLVMIALTSFLPLTPITFLYALFATVACTLFTMPALQNYFGKWGLPALTGPFVFTTWIFMLAVVGFAHVPAGIGWARP